MPSYGVVARATNTDDTTIIGITRGSNSGRVRITEIVMGADGSAGGNDYQAEYLLQRYTAAGTPGSSPTPEPRDPNDRAASASAGSGVYGAEPTYTSGKILLSIPTNLRSTILWRPWDLADALVIPDTSGNGIGVRVVSVSSTWTAVASIAFRE